MGFFSWVKEAVVSRVKNNRVVKKVTESAAYQAVTNGFNVALAFLRANRDGLNRAMTQFVSGLTRVLHLWKLVLLPIFYPDTYRALAAGQKQVILRFLTIFGYHKILRPGLTGLSSFSHSHNTLLGTGIGYTLDGVTITADAAIVVWTVREATTAIFLDNMIYNAAVAAASARDSNLPANSNEMTTNPLLKTYNDGGALTANLMNITTCFINKVFFVLTLNASYELKPFLYMARLINDGMGYRQYQTGATGMNITEQNKYFKDKIFDALAEGVIAEGFYQGSMWMLTSATPYQIVARLLPQAVLNATPGWLSYVLPFEPGFILAFTLSEVASASSVLTLIALGNMTRSLEVPPGTDMFNALYPAQLLTEKIASYVGSQSTEQYKLAKLENPKDWVTVANDKLVAWWDGWLFWGFRKAFISDCPESWDELMRRPSVQVYWVASQGQLKATVADSLKLLNSPGAKVGRKLGISNFAGKMFFLAPETRAAIKYFLKSGVVRILRATDAVLQRVEIIDDKVVVTPKKQVKQIGASAEMQDMQKVRATEPSRVNLHLAPKELARSPVNTRASSIPKATSATSAGSVTDIHRTLMLVGGSRVSGMPVTSSTKVSRKPVAAVSKVQLDPVIETSFAPVPEVPEMRENEVESMFLMEEVYVEPRKDKPEQKVEVVLDEQDEESNDNAAAQVIAESVDVRSDSAPKQLEAILEKLDAQEKADALTDTPKSNEAQDDTSLSPQMLAVSREWDQRSGAQQQAIAVSAPVAIPQPVKNIETREAKESSEKRSIFSAEAAKKKGVSRMVIGMNAAKK